MEQKPFRIVLLPFPPTPLTVFGHFIYKLSGLIDEKSRPFFNWRPQSLFALKLEAQSEILRLFGPRPDFYQRLLALVYAMKGERKRVLLRALNFINAPGGACDKAMESLSRFAKDLATFWEMPEETLAAAEECFQVCLEKGLDMRKEGIPKINLVRSHPENQSAPEPADKTWLTLPIVRRTSEGDLTTHGKYELDGYHKVSFSEGKVLELADQHISFFIGGPERSGKSTAAATLADELKNIIDSLKSRAGWSGFDLKILPITMDLGTPTLEAIRDMKAEDDEMLQRAKRPWNSELAFTALDQFIAAKREANIIIADLPGKIDYLTEILLTPADCGMIITRDWDRLKEWERLFDRMGVIKLAIARTRISEEGLESIITRYHPGKLISGRVSGLERKIRPWDPFLSILAKVLLFDFFPELVQKRRRTIERLF